MMMVGFKVWFADGTVENIRCPNEDDIVDYVESEEEIVRVEIQGYQVSGEWL